MLQIHEDSMMPRFFSSSWHNKCKIHTRQKVVANSSQQQVRQPLICLHLERVWFYSLLDRRTADAGGTARGVIDVRRQARKKIIVFGVH